jgi:hypothetical protein
MKHSVIRGMCRALAVPVSTLAFVCVLSAGAAHAQTPAAELRGGYAYISDPDFNFPFGWYADIGIPLRGAMTLVGEVGRSQTSAVEFGVPVTFSVTSYQGGVRYQKRTGSVRPFVNAIGGITRAAGGVDVGSQIGLRGLDINVSTTAYTIQPGGGVVIPVTPRLGVTVGADYRFGGSELGSLTEFRIATGIAFGLGSR